MASLNPDPSPEEITAMCRDIQSTWTPEERMRRLRADLRPTYRRCDGVNEDMTSVAYEAHLAAGA